MTMPHPRVLALVFALAAAAMTTATPAAGQVPPGQYLVTVRQPAGEMYLVDPFTRKATSLTVSSTIANDWANCVVMQNAVTGFIGTFNNPSIYAVTIAGTTVTEKLLNTNTLATGEVAQLAVVAGTIYFVQNSTLWSVPVAGGAATQLVDMTTVTGWPVAGLINGVAANITDVYLGVWSVGEVFVYNIQNKSTKLLMNLPNSLLPATGFAPVNLQMTAPALTSKSLVCLSLYGDVVTVDVTTGKVTSHRYHPSAAGPGSNLKDSFVENTDTGDWAMGTRDGAVDVFVPVGNGQIGRRDVENVGSGATPVTNRVVGIWYNPVGASYKAFGGGCAGSGGYIPTSIARGAPSKGNRNFGFGIDTTRNGTATAILFAGVSNQSPYPIDWQNFGAPSCMQHTQILVLVAGTATGTGDGLGVGTLALPLPNITATVHTQWAVYDPSNALGVVLSDARTLILK